MLTVLISVFNEEENLEIFYKQLLLEVLRLKTSFEIIFVDDGSTDNSLEILKKLAQKDTHIRIFSFRKNQGKAEALTLGFQKARGNYIVSLDADLQDKPSEIPKLLEKAKEGWDVVCGWRKNRKDPFLKILSSKLFNFLARVFWGLTLHDYNCGLKVYTKETAKALRIYGGLHRFIPLLAYQNGFRISEVAVVHEKRKYGRSKYGLSKIWKDLPDIFTMLFLSKYSSSPLHFFGTIGGILLILGIFTLGYLSVLWFQGQSIGRRPLLFLGMLLVLSGLQVFFTGFLADLIRSFSHNKSTEPLLRYSTDH